MGVRRERRHHDRHVGSETGRIAAVSDPTHRQAGDEKEQSAKAFFGKKGFAQRIAKVVDASLEPGETVLGSYPRELVSVLSADPPAKPRHLSLRFGGEKDARFTVQPVWRGEARQFAEGLGAPGP